MKRIASAFAALAFLAAAGAADAQPAGKTLTVGISGETTSLYPNWFVTTPNQQIMSHIFNNLVEMDADNKPRPGLAESWRPIDDKTWEFKLRKDVKFHDGTPFTADHVIATFDHSKTIEGVGSSAGAYVRSKTYTKVDDHTLHISAGKPYPLLPNEMSVLYIYPRAMSVDDFNAGKGMIGTGAYRFKEWIKGDRLILERNPDYWGEKPEWDRVVFRVITAGPSRVAALLNGDVDVIDYVPTPDVNRLKSDPKVSVASRPGERIFLLQLDSNRDISPYVFDNDRKPLHPNPLKDWRVRKAMSMAVNRQAIVDRIMDGQAQAAGQIATPGMFGHNAAIAPDGFDPDGAKRLLAAAGYPNGFRLTLHGSNDRYVNDSKVTEALGAMFSRIGIQTEVVTLPRAVYFPRMNNGGERGVPEFSAFLVGFGTATGETMSQHWMLVRSEDKANALGHFNYGRYANLRIDAMLDEAIRTLDDAKREAMLKDIGAQYMRDVAILPLYWQVNVWATRKGLTYEPRLMEVTHAMGVRTAK
jgi:peptide/nickel transport system substrate-binding protein